MAADTEKLNKVTLLDVAKHAGVSKMTVSRVVNNHESVNEKTREKVLVSIRAMNYRPDGAGQIGVSVKKKQVGFLCSESSSFDQGDLLLGALSAAAEEGMELVVLRVPADVSLERLKREVSTGFAGLIVPTPMADMQGIRRLMHGLELPAVFLGLTGRDESAFEVGVDDAKAAEEMTDFLISIGHSRIGFVQGHPSLSVSRFRQDGYEASMSNARLEFDRSLVAQGFFTYRSGFDAGMRLLSMQQRPTAIFASNDDMAVGVVCAAMKLGINVPRDLSVVGFEDSPIAKSFWPSITTIKQPLMEQARKAIEILSGLILNVEANYGLNRKVCLEHVIVKRESAVPPSR